MRQVKCKECGEGFTSRQYNADFCGQACRRSFNNRRMTRGAMLYDIDMLAAADTTSDASREALKDRRKGLIAAWAKEDQAAGRGRTTKRLSDVLADTLQYAAR